MAISAKDKQKIQLVTRYADIMKSVPFEFCIRHGDILFYKRGITSRAWFKMPMDVDPQVVEVHTAMLAVFAFQRLARKYGTSAYSMINPEVMVAHVGRSWTVNLGELVVEATGKTVREIIAEAV